MLLALRIRVTESSLFMAPSSSSIARGDVISLVTSPERARRYAIGILLAVPTWYVIGLLITYASELAPLLGVVGSVTAADTVLWAYLGLSAGDLGAGLLSQALQSRKKVIAMFYVAVVVLAGVYFWGTRGMSSTTFFFVCFLLGLSVGYWAMAMQMIAELFGTNLRATATTMAANVVRATVIPMGLAMKALAPTWGLPGAVALIGAVVAILAVVGLWLVQETFGRSLDFHER